MDYKLKMFTVLFLCGWGTEGKYSNKHHPFILEGAITPRNVRLYLTYLTSDCILQCVAAS